MVIRGRIQHGVIALENGLSLPEGTSVTVLVPNDVASWADNLSDEERRRIRTIMDRITSQPDENPGDSFSGADHDRALYGEP
jgi:hypothetical protein